MPNKRSKTGLCFMTFCRHAIPVFLLGLSGLTPLSGVAAPAMPADGGISLNPDLLARIPAKELQLGTLQFSTRWSAGVKLREERDDYGIPDLGSDLSIPSAFDPGAVAQDIKASSNPALTQYPRRNALRMNWIKFASEEVRMDVTQHPSRVGMRFHHLPTGLRIEAERRFINSATQIFIGVRLLEDRQFDPTVGCFLQTVSNPITGASESRNFCGFRLRVGL